MKKSFKLAIALICILALGCVALSVPACKENEEETPAEEATFSMAIIADTHVIDPSQIGDVNSEAYIDKMANSQKMLTLSSAVLKTEIDELVADDSISVVLVCGDMTEDGSKVAHEMVANELKRVEASGKKVFVTTGNHDINKNAYYYIGEDGDRIDNITPEDFATIYADFGYSEAIARDTKTLSYVADMDDTHRLISIDVCHYDNSNPDIGRDADNLTDALLAWIKTQLAACQTDGKEPIAMIHFPVTSHVGQIGVDFDMCVKVRRSEELCNALIAGGVKYVFTGHQHTNDINTYVDANGNVLYDVETGSLTNYSMPVRFYREYPSKTVIDTKELDHVNASYIPECVSAEEKAAIAADFTKYAHDYVADSMYKKIVGKLDGVDITPILGMLGADEESQLAIDISNDFYEEVFHKFFYMKLYNKDASAGEMTIESICEQAGTTLPSSNYSGTVVQFAMDLICQNYAGDENVSLDSNEYKILEKCVYSAVYILADFDVFGRLSEISEDLPYVSESDVKIIANKLIRTGKLYVSNPDIIASVMATFDYDGNNALIKMITNIDNTQGILEAILRLNLNKKSITSLVSSFGATIPEGLIDMIVNALGGINAEEGAIDIGYILKNAVLARYAGGLLIDDGVADHTLTVEIATSGD